MKKSGTLTTSSSPELVWQQQWQDGIPSWAILFKEELPHSNPFNNLYKNYGKTDV
jgi:hypothetical protein